MPIPKTANIELPLLRVIVDSGGELSLGEAVNHVEHYFPELTEEDKRRRQPSGTAFVFKNRVQWARQHLVQEGHLYREPRGIWRITPQGEAFLEEHWPTWRPQYSMAESSAPAQRAWETQRKQTSKDTEQEPEDLAPAPEPSPLPLHERLQELLHQVGAILGYYPETEFREPPYIYDVVWKEFPQAPRASCVFEVQHKGNLIEALAKLQHAKDAWGSRLFLIVTDEKDRKKIDHLVAPLLAGTFHRLARDLLVLPPDRVETLYEDLERNRDLIKKMLAL